MSSGLDLAFNKMGSRVLLHTVQPPSHMRTIAARDKNNFPSDVALNVLRDENGEYFDIRQTHDARVEYIVMDVKPDDRHLLLMTRHFDNNNKLLGKQKFLMGHDERHWFVAAVPETVPVSSVKQAKEALKPTEVHRHQQAVGLKTKELSKRHNKAFIRQGEWFFVPAPNYRPVSFMIRKNEPLVRSNGRGFIGKPHIAEEACRVGGTDVVVYEGKSYNQSEWQNFLRSIATKERRTVEGTRMVRDARVYVRGKISHPDHKTIHLDGWHRVLMNTENRAVSMRSVTFLD